MTNSNTNTTYFLWSYKISLLPILVRTHFRLHRYFLYDFCPQNAALQEVHGQVLSGADCTVLPCLLGQFHGARRQLPVPGPARIRPLGAGHPAPQLLPAHLHHCGCDHASVRRGVSALAPERQKGRKSLNFRIQRRHYHENQYQTDAIVIDKVSEHATALLGFEQGLYDDVSLNVDDMQISEDIHMILDHLCMKTICNSRKNG